MIKHIADQVFLRVKDNHASFFPVGEYHWTLLFYNVNKVRLIFVHERQCSIALQVCVNKRSFQAAECDLLFIIEINQLVDDFCIYLTDTLKVIFEFLEKSIVIVHGSIMDPNDIADIKRMIVKIVIRFAFGVVTGMTDD
ncbi:hypothetical protein D3C72_1570250 [compost metagenome]